MASEAVPDILQLKADELEAPPLTLRQLTWRRFRRHKMALLGVVILFALFLYSFGGAFFLPESYANHTDTALRLSPPSAAHPFGTDTVGRDILARTIYGGQISLLIGLTAMLVEVTLGILIGAAAGYFGGWIDAVLMRFTEAIFVVPQLFLLIVMSKYFGGKVPNITLLGRELSGSVIVVVLIIGVTSWMYLARIVRAEFISLKEREFILAAKATGTPARQVIFGHILPNCMAPIIVSATLAVASAILAESYISFLGLGVQPPTATWGNMLETASSDFSKIENAPWFWIFPGLFIVLTVLSINFVGDGLRDALDPRSRAA
ncbi:MAG: ABC transporter permease [Anaerolineae bacterium]|nr:ABC transporter permease [Anaerolineae bacterium]